MLFHYCAVCEPIREPNPPARRLELATIAYTHGASRDAVLNGLCHLDLCPQGPGFTILEDLGLLEGLPIRCALAGPAWSEGDLAIWILSRRP